MQIYRTTTDMEVRNMSVKWKSGATMRAGPARNSKTERYSYDADAERARGMLESVYWHPGLRYVIDRIYVMNPIRFTNLRRNEVKSKVLASAMMSEANGKAASYIDRNEDIQQRATTMFAMCIVSSRRILR